MNNNRPVLIMGAMDSETDLLIASLDAPEILSVGDYKFYSGSIAGKAVTVCRCLVGTVYAAAATMLGVERFSPRAVITCGTAGAHDPELHQGDIVLGENILYCGRYNTKHRDRGAGCDCEAWDILREESFGDGCTYTYSVHGNEKLLSLAQSLTYGGGKVKRGTVLTSDAWNRETDRILFFNTYFGSDCEDMESYAAAKICAMLNIPCLAVRIISNSELYPEELCDFELYGKMCQQFVIRLIESLTCI